MRIDARVDVTALIKKLSAVEKRQLPFATSKALNLTAKEVKAEVRKEMPRVFDRPTPFTLNSVYMSPATKKDLSAEVWLKDFAPKGTPAVEYLAPQVYGGPRRQKRSERWLQWRGILPSGMFWTPGPGARLNQYGNIPGGRITQMLSALKAFPEVGYMANITERSMKRNKKPRDYFALPRSRGRLPAGVYERVGRGRRGLRFTLAFIRQPYYKPRLPFFGIARRVHAREFGARFEKAWREALSTAR